MVTQVESCVADSPGDYSGCTAPANTGLSIGTANTLPGDEAVAVTNVLATKDGYTVMAKSKSGNFFAIQRAADGSISKRCGTVLTLTAGSGTDNNTTTGSCKNGSW
jgi:hypothetical protein